MNKGVVPLVGTCHIPSDQFLDVLNNANIPLDPNAPCGTCGPDLLVLQEIPSPNTEVGFHAYSRAVLTSLKILPTIHYIPTKREDEYVRKTDYRVSAKIGNGYTLGPWIENEAEIERWADRLLVDCKAAYDSEYPCITADSYKRKQLRRWAKGCGEIQLDKISEFVPARSSPIVPGFSTLLDSFDMPRQQREIAKLKASGYKQREIAKDLGISQQRVSQLLRDLKKNWDTYSAHIPFFCYETDSCRRGYFAPSNVRQYVSPAVERVRRELEEEYGCETSIFPLDQIHSEARKLSDDTKHIYIKFPSGRCIKTTMHQLEYYEEKFYKKYAEELVKPEPDVTH